MGEIDEVTNGILSASISSSFADEYQWGLGTFDQVHDLIQALYVTGSLRRISYPRRFVNVLKIIRGKRVVDDVGRQVNKPCARAAVERASVRVGNDGGK